MEELTLTCFSGALVILYCIGIQMGVSTKQML